MSKLTMQIGSGTSLILFILGTAYLMILADVKSIDSLVTMEATPAMSRFVQASLPCSLCLDWSS